MNSFDFTNIKFLNSFSQSSEFFNVTMVTLVDNNLVKGGIIVSIFWYLWFKKNDDRTHVREQVMKGIIACLVSIVIARALAILLPYRARPYLNPDLNFIMPFAKSTSSLDSWSSFPSDHAVLFFSLATSIFFISKKVGIITGIYVLLFICFPRLYLGYHYPTDILVGALVGVVITALVWINKVSKPVTRTLFQVLNKNPGLFYALFFLLTFQLCSLFSDTRILTGYVIRLLQKFIR